MYEDKPFYEDNKPPCTVTYLNEPNFELMAKAIVNLYECTRNERIENEQRK